MKKGKIFILGCKKTMTIPEIVTHTKKKFNFSRLGTFFLFLTIRNPEAFFFLFQKKPKWVYVSFYIPIVFFLSFFLSFFLYLLYISIEMLFYDGVYNNIRRYNNPLGSQGMDGVVKLDGRKFKNGRRPDPVHTHTITHVHCLKGRTRKKNV